MNSNNNKWLVFWVGGDRDGETLATFETEYEAIRYARTFEEEHKAEFDPLCGGVCIADPSGMAVLDW